MKTYAVSTDSMQSRCAPASGRRASLKGFRETIMIGDSSLRTKAVNCVVAAVIRGALTICVTSGWAQIVNVPALTVWTHAIHHIVKKEVKPAEESKHASSTTNGSAG